MDPSSLFFSIEQYFPSPLPEAPGATATDEGSEAERRSGRERRRRRAVAMRLVERALAQITDAVVLVTADARITYWNAGAEQLYGCSAEEALGRRLGEVFCWRWLDDESERAAQSALQTAGSWVGEQVQVTREGREIPVEVSLSLIHGEAGEPLGMLVVMRDISRRKQAERERERLIRALQAERARLATVFERAPAFICTLRGPEHVVDLANPAFYQLVGHREIVGRPMREALPEVGGQGFFELLDDVYRSRTPFVGEEMRMLLQRASDSPAEERFLTFVFQPLSEADAGRSGIFVHGVDITEQVRARQEIEQLYERVRQASQAKSEFLATMSHELRTPLNAVLGYAELLRLGVPDALPEGALRYVERIGASARHLLQLIEEVLTFSRLEAGREAVAATDVDLRELLDEVRAIIEPLAAAKGLAFEIVADEPPVRLRTDPRKLRQILINLLGNAVKFTPAGRVELSVEPADGQVRFRVRDTGIGLSPAQQQHLFEPFWQADQSTRRAAEGTGLGLAVSQRLARLLGGEIEVRSTEGVGSSFTVRLPLRRGAGKPAA